MTKSRFLQAVFFLGVICMSGCDMTDDRSACPVDGNIDLLIDWQSLSTGTPPRRMSVWFYGEDGGVFSTECDASGVRHSVPSGRYRILMHNTESKGCQIGNCDTGFETGHVRALPHSGVKSGPWEGSGQPLIGNPSFLFGWADPTGEVVVQTGEVTTVVAQPASYTKQLDVVARINGDFQNVTSCEAEIAGLVGEVRLHDRTPQGPPVATRPAGTRVQSGYTYSTEVFGRFGDVKNMLSFHIDCLSGNTLQVPLDISEALRELDDPKTGKVTVTVDLQVHDSEEVGFGAELVDWTYVTQGNIDIDFNE